jgi:hypothetical protein
MRERESEKEREREEAEMTERKLSFLRDCQLLVLAFHGT